MSTGSLGFAFVNGSHGNKIYFGQSNQVDLYITATVTTSLDVTSSIVFDATYFTPAQIKEWTIFFPPGDWAEPSWSGRHCTLTPKRTIPLPAGTPYIIPLSIPLPAASAPTTASFDFACFHVPGVTTAGFPATYNAVLMLEIGKSGGGDLTEVIECFFIDPSLGQSTRATMGILPEIVTSRKPDSLVTNKLALSFTNKNPEGPTLFAGPNTVFVLSFVYGSSASALTTRSLAANANYFQLSAQPSQSSWTISDTRDANSPTWTLSVPDGGPLLPAADSVTFQFDSVVTDVPPGITQLFVQYSGVPGYRDGYFSLPIQKQPQARIHFFYPYPPTTTQQSGAMSASLVFKVSHADASYDREPASSPIAVTFSEKTTYELVANGVPSSNQTQAYTTVTVAPRITSFVASPPILASQAAYTLTWSSSSPPGGSNTTLQIGDQPAAAATSGQSYQVASLGAVKAELFVQGSETSTPASQKMVVPGLAPRSPGATAVLPFACPRGGSILTYALSDDRETGWAFVQANGQFLCSFNVATGAVQAQSGDLTSLTAQYFAKPQLSNPQLRYANGSLLLSSGNCVMNISDPKSVDPLAALLFSAGDLGAAPAVFPIHYSQDALIPLWQNWELTDTNAYLFSANCIEVGVLQYPISNPSAPPNQIGFSNINSFTAALNRFTFRASPDESSFFVLDANGILYCYSLSGGTLELTQQFQIPSGDPLYSQPALARVANDSYLVAFSNEGAGVVIDLKQMKTYCSLPSLSNFNSQDGVFFADFVQNPSNAPEKRLRLFWYRAQQMTKAEIPFGLLDTSPQSLAFPESKHLAVLGRNILSFSSSGLSANTITNPASSAKPVPVTGSLPSSTTSLLVSPVGSTVYLGSASSNTVTAVVFGAGGATAVPNDFDEFANVTALAASADGATLFVAGLATGRNQCQLGPYVLARLAFALEPVPVGNIPVAVVVAPAMDYVYCLNSKDNTITVIQNSSFSVVATYPLGTQGATATTMNLSSDGKTLYVLTSTATKSQLVFIDVSNPGAPAAKGAPLAFSGLVSDILVTPGEALLLAARSDENAIHAFDLTASPCRLVQTVTTDRSPSKILFSFSCLSFVVACGNGKVDIISL